MKSPVRSLRVKQVTVICMDVLHTESSCRARHFHPQNPSTFILTTGQLKLLLSIKIEISLKNSLQIREENTKKITAVSVVLCDKISC